VKYLQGTSYDVLTTDSSGNVQFGNQCDFAGLSTNLSTVPFSTSTSYGAVTNLGTTFDCLRTLRPGATAGGASSKVMITANTTGDMTWQNQCDFAGLSTSILSNGATAAGMTGMTFFSSNTYGVVLNRGTTFDCLRTLTPGLTGSSASNLFLATNENGNIVWQSNLCPYIEPPITNTTAGVSTVGLTFGVIVANKSTSCLHPLTELYDQVLLPESQLLFINYDRGATGLGATGGASIDSLVRFVYPKDVHIVENYLKDTIITITKNQVVSFANGKIVGGFGNQSEEIISMFSLNPSFSPVSSTNFNLVQHNHGFFIGLDNDANPLKQDLVLVSINEPLNLPAFTLNSYTHTNVLSDPIKVTSPSKFQASPVVNLALNEGQFYVFRDSNLAAGDFWMTMVRSTGGTWETTIAEEQYSVPHQTATVPSDSSIFSSTWVSSTTYYRPKVADDFNYHTPSTQHYVSFATTTITVGTIAIRIMGFDTTAAFAVSGPVTNLLMSDNNVLLLIVGSTIVSAIFTPPTTLSALTTASIGFTFSSNTDTTYALVKLPQTLAATELFLLLSTDPVSLETYYKTVTVTVASGAIALGAQTILSPFKSNAQITYGNLVVRPGVTGPNWDVFHVYRQYQRSTSTGASRMLIARGTFDGSAFTWTINTEITKNIPVYQNIEYSSVVFLDSDHIVVCVQFQHKFIGGVASSVVPFDLTSGALSRNFLHRGVQPIGLLRKDILTPSTNGWVTIKGSHDITSSDFTDTEGTAYFAHGFIAQDGDFNNLVPSDSVPDGSLVANFYPFPVYDPVPNFALRLSSTVMFVK